MNFNGAKSEHLKMLNYAKFIKMLKNAQLVTFQHTWFFDYKCRLKRFMCFTHINVRQKRENERQRTRDRCGEILIQVFLIICDAYNNSFARVQRKPRMCEVECVICKITYSHMPTRT